MLIVMAGLPGTGKSTIAAAVARRLGCAVVSVDPIEAAMWTAGVDRAQPTGLAAYVVAEAVAREQLRLGHDVIVDAVNDADAARQQWRDLAAAEATGILVVEAVMADAAAHRRRLEARGARFEGFPEPTWESVDARRSAFADWREHRLRLDGADSVEANAARIAAAARPDMAIRPRTLADIDVVVGWIPDADALLLFTGPRLSWPLTAAQLVEMETIAGLTAWSCVSEGSLVGHFDLILTGDEARLGRVIVKPGARGRGLSHALVRAALAEATDQGAQRVRLSVVDGNEPAIRAYLRAGFVADPDAAVGPDVVAMVVELRR